MKRRKGRSVVLIVGVITLFLTAGCASMLSRALVPDVDTHLKAGELSHLKSVNADFNDKLLALADKDTDKKTKLALAKIIYKGNKMATDIKPSSAENMMQQYARMVGRTGVEEQVGVGIEWTKGLISQVAGGTVAGGGLIGTLIGLMRSRNRKAKALNIFKSELTPEELAKTKKAAEHTGLEAEVG